MYGHVITAGDKCVMKHASRLGGTWVTRVDHDLGDVDPGRLYLLIYSHQSALSRLAQ